MIPWEFRGRSVANCNCAPGCPCQFNSLPTTGSCHAVDAIQIETGHFGDVSLDGLRMVQILWWPGPIHELHGEQLPIIDIRADDAQRNALLTILSGKETEPGATAYNVFATTFDKVHPAVYAQIEMESDGDARRGYVKIEGFVDTVAQPIVNPVTGEEHRARIDLPNGIEFQVAEIGIGSSKTSGPITFEISDTHSQFVNVHLNNQGVVRH